MITIYVDPNDENQVMAYYRSTNPPATHLGLIAQGFVRVDVLEEHPLYKDLARYQRNCRWNNGACIERINPVQRAPRPRTRLDDLRDKLADDTINPAEIREMLRLERKL